MLGAILGDIIGSRFEGRHRNYKGKDFVLFHPACRFTDDTVMTVAIEEALLESETDKFESLELKAIKYMQLYGREYPHAGYGGRFKHWIYSDTPQPYGSYGNGAAMRISGCGYIADSLEQTEALAERVTIVTHNHPDSIKAAKAVAGGIYFIKSSNTKNDVLKKQLRQYWENFYRLNDNFTIDNIRPRYTFDVSCEGSVPQALIAFLEADSFEDTIRNAVSLGGDSDTIAAIAGGIAEAFYGVPDELQSAGKKYLDAKLLYTVERFYKRFII